MGEARKAIAFPILIGVLLAVLYDVLQEVCKLWFSYGMKEPFLTVFSKTFAGAITLLAGSVILLVFYRKL